MTGRKDLSRSSFSSFIPLQHFLSSYGVRGTGCAAESKMDAAFAFLELTFQRGEANTQVRGGVMWGE